MLYSKKNVTFASSNFKNQINMKKLIIMENKNNENSIRNLWNTLDGDTKIKLMVDFYFDLYDKEKDKFLAETYNS